ncbi:HU family DNA-binding protein [Bacteroides ihuae]|uniref:HU family DNA-binding protein n=1 Tax=Bacteroides ihuae TaxID=1852362 RepID=UPI0008D91877|nr:HU family DNA-binding protein [Bacteroides ihuae]
MPLFYKPMQSNIASKDGNKKWYPLLVRVGNMVTTQKIGEMIAEKASLTPGDVHSVIRNLMTVMREQLLNSRSVKLDGLGTFTVMANSTKKGVNKSEDVAPTQIVRLRVNFRPEYTRAAGTGSPTRALYSGVEYERWGVTEETKTPTEDGDDNGHKPKDPTA